MNVENNNTAETERELTDHELVTDHGNIVTIQTTLGDEDEDVHKCGRCQSEFSTLEAFIQHKLHQNCKRPHEVQTCQAKKPKHDQQEVSASDGNPDVDLNAFLSSDDPDKSNTNVVTEARVSRGRRKRTATASEDGEGAEATPSPDSGDNSRTSLKINNDGRYVCDICDKTFKTTNILRTHMITHSGTKNFPCDLCGSAFRTKGSLIRHNRRHTDERPYRCSLCGLSFRESGALTRHLKSITPCTEKIRFNQYKEILVSKDGVQKGVEMPSSQLTGQQEVDEQQLEDKAAVVSVVECPAQQVFHEVHFVEVQGAAEEEQVLEEQSPAEVLAEGDNLICQAIINSGITLGTEVGVKGAEVEAEGGAEGEVQGEAQGEAQGEVEVDIKDEQTEEEEEEAVPKDVVQVPEAEGRMTEIQVTEECVEMEAELEDTLEMSDREEEQPSSKMHKCPHCNRSFKGLNYLRFHVKGHLGYKPFKCVKCQKEFLTGYLLKKHMEVHLSERRYKCGECGKLYKTIGHVREHMRAHSDERPFHCNRCDKGYKTKNALQVHKRTHAQEKPYVCQYCLRGFREKGSLVRHIRHHTGEKPFKCHKCGRGFAEHGTLNRHLRAKGGCFVAQKDGCEDQADLTEDQASADSVATAAIISDDPHAVLVEFSSVVADTQEYIIGTSTAERLPGEELTVIQDGQNQMGNHIMKVVQQIVNQSRGGRGGHHIILRNVTVNEGPSISDSGDTITIATPESLTEQVSMTLASAISDGTLLAAGGALETPEGTFTMVTAAEEQEVEVMEQQEEFVITSPEVEIQTVIV